MNEKAIHNYFFDISGHFLLRLENDKERRVPLVQHLAFAIGRTLDANVSVLWRPQPDGLGVEGARWSVAQDDELLSVAAIKNHVEPFSGVLASTRIKLLGDLALHQLESSNVKLLFIAAGIDDELASHLSDLPRQLWIFMELGKESSFLSHLPSWSVLYRMVLVYMEERILTQSLHRTAEIERLAKDSADLDSMLRRAIPLLHGTPQTAPASPQEPYRADRQLLTVLIQNLFESPEDTVPPKKHTKRPDILTALDDLEKRLLLPAQDSKVRPLVEILRCWLDPQRNAPPSLSKGKYPSLLDDRMAKDWIARWTWYLRHSGEGACHQYWNLWLRHAVTDLNHLLKRWSAAPQEGSHLDQDHWQPGAMAARFLSLWLRLWFCQDLLRRELLEDEFEQHPISAAQRRRYQEDLAYTIRETLRAFVFNSSEYYRPQPERMAKALRTLVEQHAVGVARLPQDIDVRGLLEAISRSHPLGGWEFSARNLQHVFEVYIAGQFLSTLSVEGTESDHPPELRVLLADRDTKGELATSEFTHAFSMAALLHIMGRLLFPWWKAEALGNPDRRLRESLHQIGITLASAASDFTKRCFDDLTEGTYFNSSEKQALTDGLDDKKPSISEALLGAWYAHRVASGAGVSESVRRQTVRAILLSRVPTFKIDLHDDPVAALLVVCDEIFSWPSRLGGIKTETQDVFTLPNRFLTLTLSDLHFMVHKKMEGTVWQHETLLGILRSPRYLLPSFFIETADPNQGLDGTAYGVWLGIRQNLGRIHAQAQRRNGVAPAAPEPWIKIRSRQSEILTKCRLTSRALLEEVAYQASWGLRTGLTASLKDWDPEPVGNYEQCSIEPMGIPFSNEEPTLSNEELERLARDVILKHQAEAAHRG